MSRTLHDSAARTIKNAKTVRFDLNPARSLRGGTRMRILVDAARLLGLLVMLLLALGVAVWYLPAVKRR